jgi:hypothetical protein
MQSFNAKGNYQGEGGPRMNEGQVVPGDVQLSLDASQVEGLNSYQAGDKVTLNVEATLGDPGEDGRTELTVTSIEVERMSPGAKMTRNMMARRPSTEGTNLDMGEPNE